VLVAGHREFVVMRFPVPGADEGEEQLRWWGRRKSLFTALISANASRRYKLFVYRRHPYDRWLRGGR
jgi:hypothetical protein